MNELQWVDELYKAFCHTLPGMLHAEAQGLAHTLGLAPARDVPWSAVFSHGITLAAPALIAEAMPHVRGTTVQDAVLAHMLAIIDAFGTDRLQDGQIRPTWQLETLLAHVRRARDHAIGRLAPREESEGVGEGRPERAQIIDFAAADEAVLEAIQTERRLLASGGPADFGLYHAVARGKQRVALPASLALAQVAGWDARRRDGLARMLEGIGVGLQLYDDVMDWEEDFQRGGAWAVALTRGLREAAGAGADAAGAGEAAPREAGQREAGERESGELREAVVAPATTCRSLVLQSGALARMLAQASRCFRQARRRAEVFGARRVASWSAAREVHAAELARCEAESPGYAIRARALSAWARAVLA